MKTIRPIPHINAGIRIPGSKSITHRASIAAGLAEGESRIRNFLESEDTLYTAEALRQLGVLVIRKETDLKISGVAGRVAPVSGRKTLYMGNSGTSFRLLVSIAALGWGEIMMTGTPRMRERPIGPLVNALQRLGADVSCVEKDGYPPVLIKAKGIPGGKTTIAGDQSSQYLSSLLLAAPYSENGVAIEVTGNLVSQPYIDITIDVMAQFGVPVQRDAYRYFKVAQGRGYQARDYTIQGDVSSASYFWGAAAVAGGTVVTENIFPFHTRQGDICFLDVLEQMGCRVERETDRVTVRGDALSGIEADMGAMPDMVPTLAAVALFASGTTRIRNVGHLRIKESDRLRAIAIEWKKIGAKVEETPDGLIIKGDKDLFGALVDPHNDHRIAMSLAIIGSRVPEIRVQNEGCVGKSFPRFWELWDRLGTGEL